MPRKRAHIPISEIAASFAADRLPAAVRDDLRARKVSAKQILRMFTPDHVILFCWGGPDKWWNLDMRVRGPALKAKDNADTSRAAKAVRIDRINEEAQRKLLARTNGHKHEPVKPKRKIQNGNGFPPKGSRKLQSRGFEKRRHA